MSLYDVGYILVFEGEKPVDVMFMSKESVQFKVLFVGT